MPKKTAMRSMKVRWLERQRKSSPSRPAGNPASDAEGNRQIIPISLLIQSIPSPIFPLLSLCHLHLVNLPSLSLPLPSPLPSRLTLTLPDVVVLSHLLQEVSDRVVRLLSSRRLRQVRPDSPDELRKHLVRHPAFGVATWCRLGVRRLHTASLTSHIQTFQSKCHICVQTLGYNSRHAITHIINGHVINYLEIYRNIKM